MEKDNQFFGINIIIGIIVIILSILVIFFSGAALLSLMILLSIAIFFAGTARVYNTFADEKLTKIAKIIKFIVGLSMIGISLTVLITTIINPTVSILLLIYLFGYGLIILGCARIAVGLLVERYSKPYRFFLIFVGIATFIFAFIVIFFPTFGYFVLIMLISLSLLFNGLLRIFSILLDKK
jgi:uncharacterized membrane protein HdeD (DUF308 family)